MKIIITMAVLAFRVEAEYQEAVECRKEMTRLEGEMKNLVVAGKQQSKEFQDLNDEYYQVSKRLSNLATQAAETAYYMGPEFKKKLADASAEVDKYAAKLVEARKKLNDMKGSGASFADIAKQQEKVGNLSVAYLKAAESQKKLQDQARVGEKDLTDLFNNAGKGVDALSAKIGTGSPLDTALGVLSGKMKAAFSIAGIGAFLKQVYSMRSYFQDIESSMEVFLGSQQKAAKFTKDLQSYAYYNMFEFSDLAAASKQLIAYGNEVNKISGKGGILDQLSNIATATKVPLMDLVYSWNKAKSVGFVNSRDVQSWAAKGLVLKDVLKQMGEEVKGNKISFEQLQKAIAHVTSEGQMFGGIMEKMMPNLSASMGQLQDALSLMWNDIGKKLQKPMHDAIDLASNLVSNYEKVGKVLLDLVAIYGAARAGLMLYNAVQVIQNGLKVVDEFNTQRLVKSENKLTLAKLAGAKAQKALNASMLTNPYVLAAAAITGLTIALVKLAKSTDMTVMSQSKIDKYQQKAIDNINAEKQSLDEMFIKLEHAKDSREEYAKVVSDTVKMFGKYNSGLEKELENVQNLDSAYASLSLNIEKANYERTYVETKNAITESADKKREGKRGAIYSYLQKLYGDQTDANGRNLAAVKYAEIMRDIESGVLSIEKNAQGLDVLKDTRYQRMYGATTKQSITAQKKLNELEDELNKEYEKWNALTQRRNELLDKNQWNQADEDKYNKQEKAYNKFVESQNVRIKQAQEDLKFYQKSARLPGLVEGAPMGGFVQNLIQFMQINRSEQEALAGVEATYADTVNAGRVKGEIDKLLDGKPTAEQLKKIKELKTQLEDTKTLNMKAPGTVPLEIRVTPNFVMPLDDYDFSSVYGYLNQQETRLTNQLPQELSDEEKKRQAAYNARRTKAQNDRNYARQLEDSNYTIRQNEISAMYDGADKELASLKLNYDKARTQIKRQREDFVKKLNDDARAEWLANNPDKKAYDFIDPYKLVGDKLEASPSYAGKERTKQAVEIINNLREQETTALENYDAALDDFFAKYGTKEEQRKAMLEAHDATIQQLTESLARLRSERNKEKEQADLKALEDTLAEQKRVMEEAEADMKQYNGNVDLLNRPQISTDKLKAKGWKDVGEGTATVFSSEYTNITDAEGKKHSILITPILPNGEVLSEDELNAYVDENLRGAENMLVADTKGLVIAVDVKDNGNGLHLAQEKFYDAKDAADAATESIQKLNDTMEQSDKTEKATERAIELENIQKRIDDAQFRINTLGGNGTKEEEIAAKRELLLAQAEKIEDADQKRVAIAKANLEITKMQYSEGVDVYNTYEDQKKALNDLYEAEKALYTQTGDREKLLALEKQHMADMINLEVQHGGGLAKVFGDISKYTREQIKNAREIAKTYLGANPNLAPDQMKAIYDQLNAMDNAEKDLYFRGGNTDWMNTVREFMQYSNRLKTIGEYEKQINTENNKLTKKNNQLRDEKKKKLVAELELEKEIMSGENNTQRQEQLREEIDLHEQNIAGLANEAKQFADNIAKLKEYKDRETEVSKQELEKLNVDALASGMSLLAKGTSKVASSMKELAKATHNANLEGAAEALGGFGTIVSDMAAGAQVGGGYGAIAGFVLGVAEVITSEAMKVEAANTKMKDSFLDLAEAMRQVKLKDMLSEGVETIFGEDPLKQLENSKKTLEKLVEGRKELFEQYRESLNLYYQRARDVGTSYEHDLYILANERFEKIYGLKDISELQFHVNSKNIYNEESVKSFGQIAEEMGVKLYDEYNNLNVNLLQAIAQTYAGTLTEDEKRFIDAAIADTKLYEEALGEMKQYLSSLFDNTASTLADATIDGLTRGATIGADRMKEIMSGTAKDLQKQLVQSIYSKYLNTYVDEALKITTGDSKNKQKDLLDLYSKMFDNMQSTIDAATIAAQDFQDYATQRGFDISELANAETGAKAYATLSETTGSAIEGRLTSLQISSGVKENLLTMMNVNVAEIMQRQAQHVNIAQEIQSIIAESYLALVAIKNNTEANKDAVLRIEEKIDSIEAHTRNL